MRWHTMITCYVKETQKDFKEFYAIVPEKFMFGNVGVAMTVFSLWTPLDLNAFHYSILEKLS